MKGRLILLCTIAALAFSSGCVKRTLLIKSDPPGAAAFVDDRQVGVTPVTWTFYHYGEKEIRLELDGYETLTQAITLKAPSYQVFPIDFFADVLWPETIYDRRQADFPLVARREVDEAKLIQRARDMRQDMVSQTGGAPAGGRETTGGE